MRYALIFFVMLFLSCSSNSIKIGIGSSYDKIKTIKPNEVRYFKLGDSIYWAVDIKKAGYRFIAIRLDVKRLGWINLENRTYPVDPEVFIASGVYENLPKGEYRLFVRIKDDIYGPFYFTIY